MWINRPKWVGIVSVTLGLSLLMTQFQNCAPAGQGALAGISTDESPEVRVIEDWNTQKVDIFNSVVQANPEDTGVAVTGFCDRQMASHEPMSWHVSMPQDEEAVLAGAVSCQRGGFSVQITELNQLRCGMAYNLEVRTLDGEVDQAVLIRNCAL
ncbi:MAG: hypothetical protein AB7N80_10630 [Bdellovibrionales bacterium]